MKMNLLLLRKAKILFVFYGTMIFGKVQAFRKCILTDNLQWNYIMLNSFLPRYKYGLDWNDPLAENFKPKNYHLVMPAEVCSHLRHGNAKCKGFYRNYCIS